MYTQINQTSILAVLDKLGIQYKKLGTNTYGIIEDGKLSDGWRINTLNNYTNNFSNKGRITGPPFAVVKKHLNLTSHETFEWFKTNFHIRDELRRPKNRGSPRQKKNMSTSPYSRKRLNG